MGVVDDQRVHAHLVHPRDLQRTVRPSDDSQLAVGAEPDRFAVLQRDQAGIGALQAVEGAVVEDRAVLVDLHQRGAAVADRGGQHLGEVGAVGIHRPRHEAGLGAQRQRDRIEGGVDRPRRGRLGANSLLGGGGVLTLGEPVDPVVEEHDGDVHVAPQRVNQVVAADAQRVAVAGHHPDRQVVAGHRDPGGQRRRPAVDRVHAVGVDVVGESRRAADARDDHGVLALDAQLRHQPLEGGQHGVVAAARTPTHLLVGGEVLAVQRGDRQRHPGEPGAGRGAVESGRHRAVSSSSMIVCRSVASSSTEIGRPRTRE